MSKSWEKGGTELQRVRGKDGRTDTAELIDGRTDTAELKDGQTDTAELKEPSRRSGVHKSWRCLLRD